MREKRDINWGEVVILVFTSLFFAVTLERSLMYPLK
jgi:hypothetical protein